MKASGSDGGMNDPASENPSAPSESAAQTTEYQVIARRFRPRNFDEVVGQEAVANALRQSILQSRLAHAYLFCGPRGVGKTSMARIFAAALQCPQAQQATPCGECSACERIFRGEDSDVTEMDGASNRGIDDIRGLIEHVQYAPTQGRYRVFILDEVHMLTRDAFNALLKTLEEPPAHVKFVFATTEPERILPTVLSRCQRCDFSSISYQDIERRLEQICQLEGAQPGSGLLEEVAILARGGMRDAQSMLDQILAFAGQEPQLEDLLRITGRVSTEKLLHLISTLESGDLALAIRELAPILDSGTEPSVLTDQLTAVMRDQLHAGVASGWNPEKVEANLLAQEILQETRQKLRQQDRGDLVLELALMRIGTLSALVRTGVGSKGNFAQGNHSQETVTPVHVASGADSTSEVSGSTENASGVVSVSENQGGTGEASRSQATGVEQLAQTSEEVAKPSSSGMSRAQAALEALQQKSGGPAQLPQSGGTAVLEPVTTEPPSEPSAMRGMAFDDLNEKVSNVSSLTARHLTTEGHLQSTEEGWVLIVSESLGKVLDSPEIRSAFKVWEKAHGSLSIRQGERPKEESEQSASAGVETPKVISEAEEIFRAKAHRKKT